MSVRAIAALGIASFAAIVVGGLIEPLWLAPSTDAGNREIAAYVAANRDTWLASVFVFGLGMTLFLAFAASLWAWLVRQPAVSRPLAAIFGAGSVSLTTVVLTGFAPAMVLGYRAPHVADARELYDLAFGILALSGLPTALAAGSYAAIVVTARPLAGWSAWVAIVAAAAHVLIAASFFFDRGFLSLEGGVIVAIPTTMFLWFLAASVALLVRERAERPAAP